MKKIYLNSILIFLIFILFLFNQKQQISSILENELCSTLVDNVTLYHGPNTQNNKSIIILRKGYPLYVLKRKKSWLKVIDYKGRIGWVLKVNISNEKRAMIINKVILSNEEIILMPNVSVKLINSETDYSILEVQKKKIKVSNQNLWTKPNNEL